MDEMIVVSGFDSALDVAAMKAAGVLDEWLITRKHSLEIEVPGLALTRFHLKPIARSVFARYVRAAPDQGERNERAFECGVTRIDNLRPNAPTLSPTGKIDSAYGKVERWTPRELEQVYEAYVQDIGAVAWWRSFLPRETEAPFPVPQYLAAVIAYRISRSVGATRPTPITTPTEESSVSETPK